MWKLVHKGKSAWVSIRCIQWILCNVPTACMVFVFQTYKTYFRYLWLLSRNTISILSGPAIASNQSLRPLFYNTKKHFTQECSTVKHRTSKRSQVFFSFCFVFTFWLLAMNQISGYCRDHGYQLLPLCTWYSGTHRRNTTKLHLCQFQNFDAAKFILPRCPCANLKDKRIAYQQLCICIHTGTKSRLCRYTSPT